MAEITLVLAGKPRKGGELPPLEKPSMQAGKSGGLHGKFGGKTGAGPSVEEEKQEAGATKESAGFWDDSNPHVCDTCEYRTDAGCSKVEGVDFDECDQTLSGCSKWEAAAGETTGEGAEEEMEEPA